MRYLETQEGLPRVSWGAVFTGLTIALVVYLFMSILGAAIGASMLNPLSRPDPVRAFGFGSGVWMILTTVVAVFAGGYFAGRCAPVLGWLHGLLAWALMILFVVMAMTSVIGGAVGVAGNLANAGATTAAAGAGAGSDNAANALSRQARDAIASLTAAASAPSEGDARQAADSAARTVARASWFSVAALFVGFVIAVGAGALGFRHQPVLEKGEKARLPQTPVAPAVHGGVVGRH
ncbi:MAG TPA: hypothetical protein VNE00_22030 [Paraburkholderia sp.]|jgi:hypothetical protein|nr:hypothetical protein [Paraburkholderia sp.]